MNVNNGMTFVLFKWHYFSSFSFSSSRHISSLLEILAVTPQYHAVRLLLRLWHWWGMIFQHIFPMYGPRPDRVDRLRFEIHRESNNGYRSASFDEPGDGNAYIIDYQRITIDLRCTCTCLQRYTDHEHCADHKRTNGWRRTQSGFLTPHVHGVRRDRGDGRRTWIWNRLWTSFGRYGRVLVANRSVSNDPRKRKSVGRKSAHHYQPEVT